MSIRDKLTEGGIKFTEKRFFSGFWGTHFIFETRKDALKAETLTGIESRRYIKKWAITVFN